MTSQYLPLYKTIILYMLRTSASDLSRAQIMDFVLDAGYTDYMTLQQTFAELSEQALVTEKKEGPRTFLYLTRIGAETVDAIAGQIRPDIKREIDDYLTVNQIQLRNESALRTDYMRRADSSYECRMEAYENGRRLYSLTLDAPDEATALQICEQWKKDSTEIYQYILTKLTQ